MISPKHPSQGFNAPASFDIPSELSDCIHRTLGGHYIVAHKQGNLWKCKDTDSGQVAVALHLEFLASRPSVRTHATELEARTQAARIYRGRQK